MNRTIYAGQVELIQSFITFDTELQTLCSMALALFEPDMSI